MKEKKLLTFFIGNILMLIFLGIMFQMISESVPQDPRLFDIIPFSFSYFFCGLFLIMFNLLIFLITKSGGKK